MPSLSEAWEAHADEWAAWARRPGLDSYWQFHRAAFLPLVPAPGVLTLDVGCGEGRVARDLAALGHRVVALDAAPSMARHAAEAGGGLIGVLRADATRLPMSGGVADLVVAFMSLHDMDDMAEAVREIGRVLRPGGRLVLAVMHPVNSGGEFLAEGPDAAFALSGDYFEARRGSLPAEKDGLRMTFEVMHRPLRDYFAALEAAGLVTEMVREPRADDGSRWDRIPLFLNVRAVRAP